MDQSIERGGEGSEGAQVIEVSPPLPFFQGSSPHPLTPRPIHTAGTITLPITPPAGPHDPALLTKRNSASPLAVNLTAPAKGEWGKRLYTRPWRRNFESSVLQAALGKNSEKLSYNVGNTLSIDKCLSADVRTCVIVIGEPTQIHKHMSVENKMAFLITVS